MSEPVNPHPPLVVIKIGGSLLSLPDLGLRLGRLLNRSPEIRPVFIVGGGAVVDAVRAWDQTFSLGEEACHALAMESLAVTASLLTHVLPRCRIVETRRAAEACWSRGERPVLRLDSWLRGFESQHPAPPHRWDVTSDSLAACVAASWQADELWLLKSADLPQAISVADASRSSLVDRYLPEIAAAIPCLRWCNLRTEPATLSRWQRTEG